MAYKILQDIRKAISNLNPDEVRQIAEHPVNIGLVGASQESLWRMESFLCPPELTPVKRAEASRKLHRVAWDARERPYDFEIWDDELAVPEHVFAFNRQDPCRVVKDVLKARPDLAVPLARSFPPFRRPAIDSIVANVSKENALFSVATAIPDVLPFLALPWAVGEFASDTAFLTMNQIRMTFLIAAASDREPGYRNQRAEIASIIASAFGFRAIARELVGKIPFGGGLIPKAAIAYAGTQVVGRSMERVFRLGYGMTKDERRTAYEAAFEKAKGIVAGLIEAARGRQLASGRPDKAA